MSTKIPFSSAHLKKCKMVLWYTLLELCPLSQFQNVAAKMEWMWVWGLQGLDLFVQHSLHRLLFSSWNWGIWRPRQHCCASQAWSQNFVSMGKNKFLNLEVLHSSGGGGGWEMGQFFSSMWCWRLYSEGNIFSAVCTVLIFTWMKGTCKNCSNMWPVKHVEDEIIPPILYSFWIKRWRNGRVELSVKFSQRIGP